MTIYEFQKEVDHWITTVGVRYFDELTNLGILMEEVGEVARNMVRIYGEQSFKHETTKAQAHHDLKEEIGDVLFVLTCLANQCDINLEEVIQENLEKKRSRDKNRHQNNPKLK